MRVNSDCTISWTHWIYSWKAGSRPMLGPCSRSKEPRWLAPIHLHLFLSPPRSCIPAAEPNPPFKHSRGGMLSWSSLKDFWGLFTILGNLSKSSGSKSFQRVVGVAGFAVRQSWLSILVGCLLILGMLYNLSEPHFFIYKERISRIYLVDYGEE